MRAVDEWWDHAACRGKPLHWWFPTHGGEYTWNRARRICSTCPVATACADYADQYGATHGMYGGLTPDERATPDPRCGTGAGFQAHRIHGTNPCDPCRAAHNTDRRRLARLRKAANQGNGDAQTLAEATR